MSDKSVVQARVKELVQKKEGFRMGDGFIEALSDKVEKDVANALERAEKNGRKTVRAEDI